MLGHVILISAQVNSRAGVPLLEAVTFGGFAEVQRAMSAGVSGVRRVWGGYIGLRHVKEENEALKRQLAEAQIELQGQRALADRSRGLERLLESARPVDADDRGRRDHRRQRDAGFPHHHHRQGHDRAALKPNMAVIAPAGVVGRVVVPSARAAKVQLLIDRNAAAGAIIERSRAQGAGDWRRRRPAANWTYVSEIADIVVGDVVMTSGIDGIYPKGFVIGRVETVEKNGPAYKRIVVQAGGRLSRAGGGPDRADADGRRTRPGASSEERRGRRWPSPWRWCCRPRWRGSSCAARVAVDLDPGRGRLRRADVRPDHRAARRARRPAWPRTRCRAASSASAGWRRPSSASSPAPSARSSSSPSRCRGSWCSSPPPSLHAAISIGLYLLLDLRQFGSPVCRGGRPGPGQRGGGRGGFPAGRTASRRG